MSARLADLITELKNEGMNLIGFKSVVDVLNSLNISNFRFDFFKAA